MGSVVVCRVAVRGRESVRVVRASPHLYIVLDARVEVGEVLISRHVVEVVRGGRKVAAIHRHPPERVAVPAVLGAPEIEPDDLVLFLRGKQAPVDGRRLGEGAAEADDGLVRLRGLKGRVHIPEEVGVRADRAGTGESQAEGEMRMAVRGRQRRTSISRAVSSGSSMGTRSISGICLSRWSDPSLKRADCVNDSCEDNNRPTKRVTDGRAGARERRTGWTKWGWRRVPARERRLACRPPRCMLMLELPNAARACARARALAGSIRM